MYSRVAVRVDVINFFVCEDKAVQTQGRREEENLKKFRAHS
jgi:hypothetical protein